MLKFVNEHNEIVFIQHDDGTIEILNEELKKKWEELQQEDQSQQESE